MLDVMQHSFRHLNQLKDKEIEHGNDSMAAHSQRAYHAHFL
jgi:hypothetical protein